VNVAVTTALATNAIEKMQVEIVSDPTSKTNCHCIELRSPNANVNIEIASTPSVDNPGSSSLAAWSVIALLKRLASPITF
jgi:aspartate dehydrogenase